MKRLTVLTLRRDLCYRFMIESYGDRPRTMIISTHLITEVEGLVEHAVVLDHGRVLNHDMNELAQRGRMLCRWPDRYGGTWPTMVCIRCRKYVLGGLLTVGVRGVPSAPTPENVVMRSFDLNEYVIQITGIDKGRAS